MTPPNVYQRIFEFSPDAVLVIAGSGRIALANAQAAVLFGYDREALLGLGVEDLLPARHVARHAAHRAAYLASPRLRPMSAKQELFARCADGRELPVDIMLGPIETDDGPGVLCVVRDVTERQRAERHLRASLAEKEVLLKEIHHRVKNNLAVISSLLYLHGARVGDPALVAAFEDSRDRIRAMALVHETLYRADALAAVDLGDYARALCGELAHAHRPPACDIRVDVVAEAVPVGIDVAVPCGLILNELITNALKHAFRGRAAGAVAVRIGAGTDAGVRLVVEDDGVGLPAGASPTPGSLGLELVHLLARQLGAQLSLAGTPAGTRATLDVPRREVPA